MFRRDAAAFKIPSTRNDLNWHDKKPRLAPGLFFIAGHHRRSSACVPMKNPALSGCRASHLEGSAVCF